MHACDYWLPVSVAATYTNRHRMAFPLRLQIDWTARRHSAPKIYCFFRRILFFVIYSFLPLMTNTSHSRPIHRSSQALHLHYSRYLTTPHIQLDSLISFAVCLWFLFNAFLCVWVAEAVAPVRIYCSGERCKIHKFLCLEFELENCRLSETHSK